MGAGAAAAAAAAATGAGGVEEEDDDDDGDDDGTATWGRLCEGVSGGFDPDCDSKSHRQNVNCAQAAAAAVVSALL